MNPRGERARDLGRRESDADIEREGGVVISPHAVLRVARWPLETLDHHVDSELCDRADELAVSGERSQTFNAAFAHADAALRSIAQLTDERFLVALAIANPDLCRQWLRHIRDPPRRRRARHGRLERAVLTYLLRSVGRCTPHGGWAGVVAVEPAATGGDSVEATPASEEAMASLDLRVLEPVIATLGQAPSPRLGLRYRLVRAVAGDVSPQVGLLVEAFGDGRPKSIRTFLDAVATVGGPLRASLEAAAVELVGRGVLIVDTRMDLDVAQWTVAVERLGIRLDQADQRSWEEMTAPLSSAVDAIAAAALGGDAELALATVERLSDLVGRLWRWAGVVGDPPSCCAWVDVRSGWRVSWGRGMRTTTRLAVCDVLGMHLTDNASEDHRRAALTALIGTSDVVAVTDVMGRLTRHGHVVVTAFAEADEPCTEMGHAVVCHPPPVGGRAGPWGDQLFVLGPGDELVASWGRPQPGMFRHRQRAIIGDDPCFAELVDSAASPHGLRAAAIARVAPTNPGAMLGGCMLTSKVTPEEALAGQVVRLPAERGSALRCADGTLAIPVHTSAALIGLTDPLEKTLYRVAMSTGLERLGYPLSRLLNPPRGVAGRSPRRRGARSGVILTPKRWVIDTAPLIGCEPAERFVRWRAIVAREMLPALVWVTITDDDGELPLPMRCDSPLHLWWLFDRSEPPAMLTVLEGPGDVSALRIAGPDGHHHAELAVTWVDRSALAPAKRL